ncbi:MAG TPA: NAD(P)H-dependent oxidoreductase [Solirubrobacterales bacterium]|jgi:FMN reductase
MSGAGEQNGAAGRPFVVGLGGTPRPGSTSERALEIAMAAAREAGARTAVLTAAELELPLYQPGLELDAPAAEFVTAIARADGVLISTPGYHGGVSGLLKNALDYTEELREGPAPYLDGKAVGCIVCAHGWQAGTTTLVGLRSIVHALRGWPTPLGVAINSSPPEDGSDVLESERVLSQLQTVARQVVDFAQRPPRRDLPPEVAAGPGQPRKGEV